MSERIAFIGFGEAGQTIGRGLLAQGARICAYDILFDDPADGGKLAGAAAQMKVAAARGHAAAVQDADLVFLAVTASSSLEAARSCLPGLHKGQLFLDINSVSPQRKIETAARQQWLADLKVKDTLKEKTEDRAELVRAIRRAMKK